MYRHDPGIDRMDRMGTWIGWGHALVHYVTKSRPVSIYLGSIVRLSALAPAPLAAEHLNRRAGHINMVVRFIPFQL